MVIPSLARPEIAGLYLHRKPVRGGADGGVSDTCFREDNHAKSEDRLPRATSSRTDRE
jgi:hypothetical protein